MGLTKRKDGWYVEFPVIDDGKVLQLARGTPGAKWKRWKTLTINKTVAKQQVKKQVKKKVVQRVLIWLAAALSPEVLLIILIIVVLIVVVVFVANEICTSKLFSAFIDIGSLFGNDIASSLQDICGLTGG